MLSPSTVILEPKKIKDATVSTFPPSICHEVMRLEAMILVFRMLSFKPTSSLPPFTFIKRLFSSSLLSAVKVVSSAYLMLWYSSRQSWFQLVLHPVQHFSWCTPHISSISRETIYSLDILLFLFGTSLTVPCSILTVASWPAYRFLKRQVRWSGIPISLRIFHNFLWSTQSTALAYSVKQK